MEKGVSLHKKDGVHVNTKAAAGTCVGSQKTPSPTGDLDDDDSESLEPSGSYKWVVVSASFFNAFIIDGVGSCFGLLFPHIVKKFDSSAFVASFAGSLFVALMVMGSISAELVRRFGFRAVSMTGGLLSCLSFVAASFSTNIVVFILTYGLLAGCSCGLVFLPSIVIVNAYFHRNRGLANGIITAGSGAGLLCLAPFINWLLEHYQLEGTVLILAGVLLNMCVFSALYRPPLSGQRPSPQGQPDPSSNDTSLKTSYDGFTDMFVDSRGSRKSWNSDLTDAQLVCLSQECSEKELVKTPEVKITGVEKSSRNEKITPVWEDLHLFHEQKSSLGGHYIPNRFHHSIHNIPDSFDLTKVLVHNMPSNKQHHRSELVHMTASNGSIQHLKKQRNTDMRKTGLCPFDNGSNLYLTGSVNKLKQMNDKYTSSYSCVAGQKHDSHVVHKQSDKDFRIQERTSTQHIDTHLSNHQLQPSEKGKTHVGSDRSLLEISSVDLDEAELCELQPPHKRTKIPPPSALTIRQLLRRPVFIFFAVGAVLIQFGYPIAGTFLADYAYQFGLTTAHSAILMAILGSSNIVGRLLAGCMASLGVNPLKLNSASLLCGGIVCLLAPFYKEFWLLCLMAALFGFFLGFFPPLQPLILVEFFGLDSLVSSFGFLTTIKGLANIIGAPVAGWIYDASGDYAWSFFFAGVCFSCSFLFHWLMMYLKKLKHVQNGR